MRGIDVSKFQKEIDWQKVKASGIEFAFVRVGWAGYEGGIDEGKDPFFETNMKGAIAAGIHVGVYVYSYCKTPAAAQRAAREAIALCAPYRMTMPLAFDIENDNNAPIYKGMSRAQVSDICAAFLAEVEKAGYYSMLYTYKSFANDQLDMSKLTRWDFWLAHYTAQTNYTGPYGIWQYTSSGSVPGINGRVDMDIAYKDYPAIIGGVELGEQIAPMPVVMTCAATGGDQRTLGDVLDGLGIGYQVIDNVMLTNGEVTTGDQRRLTAAAKKLGIEWTVYVEPEQLEQEPEIDDLLTDEPEEKPEYENPLKVMEKEIGHLQSTVDKLRRAVNILLRRADIPEV